MTPEDPGAPSASRDGSTDALPGALSHQALREMAHEITNPLMAISGLAEMVMRNEKDLKPESRLRLEQILVNCDRVTAILRAQIDRTRPSSGAPPKKGA